MLIRRCSSITSFLYTKKSVVPRQWLRSIYSIDGKFDKYLESDMIVKIEQHWKPKIKDIVKKNTGKEKYYVLSMFPYPSGKLHMGHVRVYTLSDTFAHYQRMRNYNVIHPMGWDAFGLPAENAAIENKVNPKEWTEQNIVKMKEQLLDLGCTFDWEREFATCDPSYYKWTQYLFLEMYKAGLVFQKESIVNWDPVDQTVLADEQVDHNGCSWRSGAKVEKRPLRQWFFKTTKFAHSLLDGLQEHDQWSWRDIVKAQKNWIGNCDGTNIEFAVESSDGKVKDVVTVWTNRPELIYGTEFIAIHPDHIINNQYPQESLLAVNPFTHEKLPLLVTNDLEYNYGSQTILGVPNAIQEQQDFAAKNGMSGKKNVVEERQDKQFLVNSGKFSGMSLEEGAKAVMESASLLGIGGYPVSSNLQDWLISRQRYWGTPIPVIHCDDCGAVPVPQSDLPVELPHLEGLTDKGMSPLLEAKDWLHVPCPKCGKPARRETDTMDTFVDSSWYFLRYLDPDNKEEPFSQEAAKNMPVDLYIGGKEHAYLHLYFARFFCHFLHSQGKLEVREPFKNLVTQGMVKGQSYRVKGTNKFLRPEQVKEEDGKFFEQETGKPLVVEWEKMSKSKHNGVDPSLLIDKYGCDTVRMMMLHNVAPHTERNWSEKDYLSMRNFQIRLWKLVSQALELQNEDIPELRYEGEMEEHRATLRKAKNDHLRYINFNYNTRNTAVILAKLNVLTTAAWVVPGKVKRDAPEFQEVLGTILICLAPIAPHFCCELWAGLASLPVKNFQDFDWDRSVLEQDWPQLDPTSNLPLKLRANGKDMGTLDIAKWRFDDLTEDAAFDLACHHPSIQEEVLPHEIIKKDFSFVEDFEASLTLIYRQDKDIFDREAMLKRKAEAKEAKKAAKAERMARRAENIKRVQELEKKKAAKGIKPEKK